jgi:hypothetical protein
MSEKVHVITDAAAPKTPNFLSRIPKTKLAAATALVVAAAAVLVIQVKNEESTEASADETATDAA